MAAAHADNPIDIQEFMILPTGAATFAEGLRMGAEIFHSAQDRPEGGWAQHQCWRRGRLCAEHRDRRGSPCLHREVRSRPLATGPVTDFLLGLDVASTEFFKGGRYDMAGEGKTLDPAGMVDYLAALAAAFPIATIEDGCAEDDFEGWKLLTDKLGGKVQLVGDDLFVTNPARLADGIERGLANSILVKVNQIGTLSETLDAVDMAHRRRLHIGDEPPVRRDRRLDHRRPVRRCELRADQDRLPGARRPDGQIQSAAPD